MKARIYTRDDCTHIVLVAANGDEAALLKKIAVPDRRNARLYVGRVHEFAPTYDAHTCVMIELTDRKKRPIETLGSLDAKTASA